MMNEFDYPTCIVVGRESVKGTEAGWMTLGWNPRWRGKKTLKNKIKNKKKKLGKNGIFLRPLATRFGSPALSLWIPPAVPLPLSPFARPWTHFLKLR
jgi:hypothetical protein